MFYNMVHLDSLLLVAEMNGEDEKKTITHTVYNITRFEETFSVIHYGPFYGHEYIRPL